MIYTKYILSLTNYLQFLIVLALILTINVFNKINKKIKIL